MQKTKQRYKLTIEYDGSNYCGFQKQFNIQTKSIEEALEDAIFKMSQEKVKIFACGRTDTGVHSLGQVVHFDLEKKFEKHQIILGLNHFLSSENIVIIDCELVDENFHARFDSKQRSYLYKIINRTAPLTIDKNRAWHIAKTLDISAMQFASEFLIGNHDFSSFRDSECQAKTPIRSIEDIRIEKNGSEVLITIKAKSFLHHMVRNIVGTLVYIGLDKINSNDMKNILQAKDRKKSGPNAPAYGLYFLGSLY